MSAFDWPLKDMTRERDEWKALCESAEGVIEGLMEIAEIAMPDSYFHGDSRTTAARKWLAQVGKDEA